MFAVPVAGLLDDHPQEGIRRPTEDVHPARVHEFARRALWLRAVVLDGFLLPPSMRALIERSSPSFVQHAAATPAELLFCRVQDKVVA